MQAETFDSVSWNNLVATLPYSHLLQTWEWAQVKAKYGWQPMPFVWRDAQGGSIAAAMILKRAIPVGGFAKKMCVLYIPKGPLMNWGDAALRQQVLDDIQAFARRQGAIFVKMDPDIILGRGIPGCEDAKEGTFGQDVIRDLERRGWSYSPDQIQFKNTVEIDLEPSEEDLLARMKQKTRYNIRLAEKKGVTVRAGSAADLPLLYRLYAETSVRDGFVIRDEGYYQTVWTTFMESTKSYSPIAQPLIADVDGEPVAAIIIFYFANRTYYLYGMSRQAHREKMPNHLLQWEAIRKAKAAGCRYYDLWGAPDVFNESDGMWGVFRFKEGLGGQVVRTIGAWDYTPSPFLYKMYTRVIPRLLDVMRSRGMSRVQAETQNYPDS